MRRMATILVAAAAATAVAACDGGTGLNDGAVVEVAFETRTTSAGGELGLLGFGGGLIAGSIEVSGTNGVLSIDTVHVIMAEFELEREDDMGACDDDGVADDSDSDDDGDDDRLCPDFDAPPSFLSLPLGDGPTTVVTAQIPAGVYEELEFEIEDLEDDEDDGEEARQIAELLEEIRGQFPNWPREASMRVAGTFTPAEGETAGEAQRFVVYMEAEIEVELEFDTPFVVTETDVGRTITVELDPADWFRLGGGTVINLAAHDYETTGSLLEFEVEIENGFKSVEHDDD